MMLSTATRSVQSLLVELPRPLTSVLLALLALALVGLSVLAAIWLWQFFLRREKIDHPITLRNSGNLATVFQLRVNLNGLPVTAQWFLGNQALKTRAVEQITYIEEPLSAPAPVQRAGPLGAAPADKSNPKAAALSQYRAVRAFASLIANIAASLGALLPGAAGDALRSISDSVRQGQQAVDQPVNQANRLSNTGAQLNANLKQLQTKTGRPASTASAQPAAHAAEAPQIQRQFQSISYFEQALETSALAPAEQVTYRLVLSPRNLLRTPAGSFNVTSRQLENPSIPAGEPLQPQELAGAYAARSLAPQTGLILLGVYAGLALLNGLCVAAILSWIFG